METLAFIERIIEHCNSVFPMQCKRCLREFRSFEDYVTNTARIGPPEAYGITTKLGLPTLSFANCRCGNTIALECDDDQMRDAFVAAVQRDAHNSGRSVSDVLDQLAREVRRRAVPAPQVSTR